MPNDALLKEAQRVYRDWTESYFKQMLDPSPWQDLGDEEKAVSHPRSRGADAPDPEHLAEDLDRIFTRFYRVKNEKTAGISGTGLGLATARRVAAEYNGTIEVVSAPDKGSTFTVKFPT